MTLSYDEIFSNFLGYVSDYDIASMSNQDANDIMTEWLHKSCANPYLRRLFSKSILDDNIQTFTYEMDYITEENADNDFVINVLAKSMIVEWLTPLVRNKVNISQMFGGKEAKWFSQAQHISELRGLLEDTQLEVRRLIRDRGYIWNSYLEDK